MSGLLENLLHVPALLAYAVITALVFSEAALFVGFVLPGETAVVLGGVLAAAQRISLVVLLGLVVAAAIVGDSVGYEVGRHFGPRVLALRFLRKHQHRIEGAQRSLRERGGWAVFVGRFTAFLRAVMPGLAGLSRMPYPRFLAYNAAGGIIWGVGVAMLGYLAGNSYQKVASALGQGGAILAAVLVVGGLLAWQLHRRRHRPETEAS
jgi:membrane-associated protein